MKIVLTTRDQTNTFLLTHPDPDEVICWGCPECHARNYGTYFSHSTRCGACGKGAFPPIPLPVVGDGSVSMARAYQKERLKNIEKEMKETKNNIEEYERHLLALEKTKAEIGGLIKNEDV